MKHKVISIAYVVIAIAGVLSLLNVYDSSSLKLSNEYRVSYLPNVSGVCIYTPLSKNTMKCNLTTVSVIIKRMIEKDYFVIEKDYSDEDILDVLLSNGEEKYRILYNRETGDYLCMSKPFLKNYVPATYINDWGGDYILEYFNFIVYSILDSLEEFFKNFTLVSGTAVLRVLLFTIVYLFISIIATLTQKFTFTDLYTSSLAVFIMILINLISSSQRRKIKKVKEYILKGEQNVKQSDDQQQSSDSL